MTSTQSLVRNCAAELFGTFILVLFGCGAASIAGELLGPIGVALVFGLTLCALAYTIGGISGAHLNPAVTIAMLFSKKIKGLDAFWYIVMQCLGAILAALLLLYIVSGVPTGNPALGANMYGPPNNADMGVAFVAELILTLVFVLTILAQSDNKVTAGLVIGLTLVAVILVGFPLTGTSVNPARSLGPALVVGGAALEQVWLFILAPILGAIGAALIWRGFHRHEQNL